MKMRILAAALVASAAFALAAPAQATVTIKNFTVTGTVVSGTFSLAFDDTTSVYSLSALNITLAGSSVSFDTSNSGVISLAPERPGDLEIGGLANGGVHSVGQPGVPPADDWAFVFVPTTTLETLDLTYATAGSVKFDTVTLQAAAVPEPTTWAMFLFGFGAMGIAVRRRWKSLAVKIA